MSKYCVTGGAGFIGSNIVQRLVERGERVVIIDDLSTGREENIRHLLGDVEFVKGDIRDPSIVRGALEGVSRVIHQAALASVPRSIENPVLVNDVNIGGTVVMLEESRKAGVDVFVYAASSSAYGDTEILPKREDMLPRPLSPYAVSKLAGEYYCSVYNRTYGLPTVSLRYFNVFGPRQDPRSQYAAVIPIFVSHLLGGERPTIYGDGEQSRDFTYVTNVVNANLLAAECGRLDGQVVNVACGASYTVNELFGRLRELIGNDVDPVYAEPRPGDVRHSLADISIARELLEFDIAVSFEEGLEQTVAWYRSRDRQVAG
jgi:nucleoside-diphosphate-sugar epimerase